MALRLFAVTFVALAIQSAHASCNGDAACASNADADVPGATSSPASLLQKIFKHTQEPPRISKDATCTGVDQQGRCWFLSELGETCDSTCAKQGRRFSFAIADGENSVTPALVNHIPKVKQEAWAALECYSPSEDRYHPANPNAARHFSNDIGNWSHENCKLACPCGGAGSKGCVWKPAAACAPKFMWHGVEYAGCATVDIEHEKPWCQFAYEHTEKGSTRDWSSCIYSCDSEESTPTRPSEIVPPTRPSEENTDASCGWSPAPSCVNEYTYEGNRFVGCTGADNDRPWCSNSDPYVGSWSQCVYTCDKKPEPVAPSPQQNTDTSCGWSPAPSCVNEYTYEGNRFAGCTGADNDRPWCSNSDPYVGSWSQCVYTCDRKPEPVAPSPQPIQECTWQANPECSTTFEYKGGNVTGCTDLDHPTPWCSRDRVHRDRWERCTRVCGQVPVAPAPVPAPVPVPQPTPTDEDPCERHPETENDSVGNDASLDEVGYKVTAAAESPINMKRFVCRVVAKIGCKVTDQAGLLGFLPFYSGLVDNQSYMKLENELTTLCEAGGRWVQVQQP